jgi:glycosyltransferase involved in cell wall biosynthesis
LKASIVIPCLNESADIEACLQSVFSQQTDFDQIEVIVADGMSDDGTRRILDRLALENSRLRVIDNPERTVSAGLNAAIRAAKGQVIIRMDAHTEYAPDYVGQCLEVLEKTGADNVGGPWVAKGSGYIGEAIAAAFQSSFAVGGARGHKPDYEGPIDTVYLGCWRREVFERIGFFDEELVRNQDDEFNLRLSRSGGLIWQSPRIRSWYRPRASLYDLFRQYLQYGYWKVRVIQKHRLPASVRHLIPAGFVTILGLLLATAPLAPASRFGFFFLVLTYGLFTIAASTIVAVRSKLKLLPVLPAVFVCYHFSYGIGFVTGVWDFVVRNRSSLFARRLTRPSGKVGTNTEN